MARAKKVKKVYPSKSTRITLDLAHEMMASIIANAPDAMRRAWDATGEDVMAEILAMRQHREDDPVAHAQAALICSILSPGNKLPKNIRQAVRVMECLDQHFDCSDALYQCATNASTDHGGRGLGNNVKSLLKSLDYIRHINPALMTKEALLTLRENRVIMGIGPKTASFAAAMYDECAPVFTLDVHMMRWLCIVGDRPELVAGSMNIDDDAYAVLEPVLVALAHVAVPDAPVFGIQWACWNEVSDEEGEDAFRPHAHLFGL